MVMTIAASKPSDIQFFSSYMATKSAVTEVNNINTDSKKVSIKNKYK